MKQNIPQTMRLFALPLLGAALLPSLCSAQAPVFAIDVPKSKITFSVKASVAINGTFDKWDAALKFTSPDVSDGSLQIKIQAASVNTGSGMKDGKLKGEDFFDVKKHEFITFISKKIVMTAPDKFSVEGDFTIRGVSKPETLTLSVAREGDGTSGRIVGQMAFDRKQYGMTHGIPFIKIADRVQVDVNLAVKRTSGPPVTSKAKPGA